MKSKLLSRSLRWSAALALFLPGIATADTIYQSATAGAPTFGGFTVDSRFYLGVRFQATSDETATQIGGNFSAGAANQSIFGALVALSGPSDFPNDYPITSSSSDVLAHAVLNLVQGTSQDITANLNTPVNLTTGSYYALLFGSGVFGASGGGGASADNVDNGAPSFFNTSTTTGYSNGDDGLRFFLLGSPTLPASTPLPSAAYAGLALTAAYAASQLRRRTPNR